MIGQSPFHYDLTGRNVELHLLFLSAMISLISVNLRAISVFYLHSLTKYPAQQNFTFHISVPYNILIGILAVYSGMQGVLS